MFPFLRYKKYYFIFSGLLISASIFFLIYFGLNLGIDFAGGSILRVEYKEKRPPIEEISAKISQIGLTQPSFRTVGERGLMIKTKDIDPDTKAKLVQKLLKTYLQEYQYLKLLQIPSQSWSQL